MRFCAEIVRSLTYLAVFQHSSMAFFVCVLFLAEPDTVLALAKLQQASYLPERAGGGAGAAGRTGAGR